MSSFLTANGRWTHGSRVPLHVALPNLSCFPNTRFSESQAVVALRIANAYSARHVRPRERQTSISKSGMGIQVLGYTAAVIIAIRSGKPADMQRLRASPPWMKREHRRLFSNNALHLKRCLGRTCHARHFNPQRPLGLNTYSTVPIHVPCAH